MGTVRVPFPTPSLLDVIELEGDDVATDCYWDIGDYSDLWRVERAVPPHVTFASLLVSGGTALDDPDQRVSGLAFGALLLEGVTRVVIDDGMDFDLEMWKYARDVKQDLRCRNPFRSIVVRALEVLYAVDEAIRLIDDYTAPEQPRIPVIARAGTGHGATEAPRGLLYHRYSMDPDGIITAAEIIPPTSQNQPAIEHDLWNVVEGNLQLPDDELQQIAETTIRNYDPCISCATHFLDLTVTRR